MADQVDVSGVLPGLLGIPVCPRQRRRMSQPASVPPYR